jgi:hypothetical protein
MTAAMASAGWPIVRRCARDHLTYPSPSMRAENDLDGGAEEFREIPIEKMLRQRWGEPRLSVNTTSPLTPEA